jgi:hypothetical protein
VTASGTTGGAVPGLSAAHDATGAPPPPAGTVPARSTLRSWTARDGARALHPAVVDRPGRSRRSAPESRASTAADANGPAGGGRPARLPTSPPDR